MRRSHPSPSSCSWRGRWKRQARRSPRRRPGVLATGERRGCSGLSEAWPTRLAWLCVAGASGGTAMELTHGSINAFTDSIISHSHAPSTPQREESLSPKRLRLLEEEVESRRTPQARLDRSLRLHAPSWRPRGPQKRGPLPLIRDDDPDAVAATETPLQSNRSS